MHRLAVTPEPSTIATEMPRSWTGVTAALFGMSPASSVGLIAHLRSHQPELPILAILETPTPSEWRRVLLAGASGAIALSAEPARLAELSRFPYVASCFLSQASSRTSCWATLLPVL